jgi:hypothetical protein
VELTFEAPTLFRALTLIEYFTAGLRPVTVIVVLAEGL